MPELLSYCDVLVADIDSIKIYLGIHTESGLQEEIRFRKCAEAVREKLPYMKTLAMSFRGKGQWGQQTYQGALYFENECYFTTVHDIPLIVDRIGSGDAFTAGLIYALCHRHDPRKMIEFALACGVLKHSMGGDFALLSKEEVLEYVNNGPTGRIIR
jgi:2-dehydro-3-deoxygluconokinase